MTDAKNKIAILGSAPSIHGIPVEADDYCIMLAQFDEGPTGYVIKNKHTDVLEYVARSYSEAVNAMRSFQNSMDELRKTARPVLKTVQ